MIFRKRDEEAAKKLETMTNKIEMIEFVRQYVEQGLELKIQEAELVFQKAERIREVFDICLSALQDQSPDLASQLRKYVGDLSYAK